MSTIARAQAFHLPLSYSLMPGEEPQPDTLDHIFLRLDTDDGLTGWGEGFGYKAAPLTYAALDQMICPALIGMAADDIPATIGALDQQFHQAGRHGAVLFALSAVDIALWDIAGKRAGKPVAELIGGVKRGEIPAYASLLRIADETHVASRVRDAVSDGYGAIKLHEIEEKFIRAARATWPEGRDFMLDINCGWSADETLAMDEALSDCAPTWFEEPIFPPEDFAAMAALRSKLNTPVAAGENAGNLHAFKAMIGAGAVDIVQPSVTKAGGITGLLDICALANQTQTTCRPHCAYFGPGLWANLQVLAARDDQSLAEFYYVAALPQSPYGDAIFPKDGRMRLPGGPGLGMDPDPDLVLEMRRKPA